MNNFPIHPEKSECNSIFVKVLGTMTDPPAPHSTRSKLFSFLADPNIKTVRRQSFAREDLLYFIISSWCETSFHNPTMVKIEALGKEVGTGEECNWRTDIYRVCPGAPPEWGRSREGRGGGQVLLLQRERHRQPPPHHHLHLPRRPPRHPSPPARLRRPVRAVQQHLQQQRGLLRLDLRAASLGLRVQRQVVPGEMLTVVTDTNHFIDILQIELSDEQKALYPEITDLRAKIEKLQEDELNIRSQIYYGTYDTTNANTLGQAQPYSY